VVRSETPLPLPLAGGPPLLLAPQPGERRRGPNGTGGHYILALSAPHPLPLPLHTTATPPTTPETVVTIAIITDQWYCSRKQLVFMGCVKIVKIIEML
jgi:hypothetical protein